MSMALKLIEIVSLGLSISTIECYRRSKVRNLCEILNEILSFCVVAGVSGRKEGEECFRRRLLMR